METIIRKPGFLLTGYFSWIWVIIIPSLVMLVILLSCHKEIDPEEHALKISEYLNTLNYDPDNMLEVQNIHINHFHFHFPTIPNRI